MNQRNPNLMEINLSNIPPETNSGSPADPARQIVKSEKFAPVQKLYNDIAQEIGKLFGNKK